MSIEDPFVDVVIFLQTMEPTNYVKSLTRRISGYRATQLLESRYGKTENPWIAEARAQDEHLREEIVKKTELVHSFSLYIYARRRPANTQSAR